MNSNILSLKLPPEVAKIMPWVMSAKASGDPKMFAWAKEQHEHARRLATEREESERRRKEREERHEFERKMEFEHQERERQAEEEELRRLQTNWDKSRVHPYRYEPEGYEVTPNGICEEYLPPHGGGISGFRQFMSACREARWEPPKWLRYSWGCRQWRQGKRDKKRNRGQKRRTFRNFH